MSYEQRREHKELTIELCEEGTMENLAKLKLTWTMIQVLKVTGDKGGRKGSHQDWMHLASESEILLRNEPHVLHIRIFSLAVV